MRRRLLINVEKPVEPYLNVLPVEVVWVSVELQATYDVYSNTDWIVE